jgi:NitT/TauT family transport system substrate-binding protein
MKTITKIVCAAVVAISTSSAALAQDKPNGGDTQIRVQEYPGSILGIPMWVAIEKGFCKNYNIRCSTVGLASGPLGLQTLAAGSIEATFASNEVNLMAASRGNEIQLVVGHSPNNYYTLNVSSDYPLPNRSKGYPESMKDLKGAKVGVTARGSGIEIVTRALLQGAGMKGDDVTYVAVGAPATSYPALLAKQIDASVSFEPFNTLCLAQKTCVELVSPGKGEGPANMLAMNGGFASFTMRKNFVQSNPKATEAFIAAVRDAITWAKDPKNYDELVAITKKKMSMGDIPDADKVLALLVKGQTTSLGYTIERKAVDATSDFLIQNKLSEKAVSSASVVYEKAPKP